VSAAISLIAAVARNGVIGAEGAMPWRLRTDMLRFKALTMGKPVVMGRRTYESIGKPLAGRLNIVVSGAAIDLPADVVRAASPDEALRRGADAAGPSGEVMVIGGGAIYAATIGQASRLFITHVDAAPEGDTHFPAIDPAVWTVEAAEEVPAGEKDSASTRFVIYRRI
jgi:dihydrofolate reductase